MTSKITLRIRLEKDEEEITSKVNRFVALRKRGLIEKRFRNQLPGVRPLLYHGTPVRLALANSRQDLQTIELANESKVYQRLP